MRADEHRGAAEPCRGGGRYHRVRGAPGAPTNRMRCCRPWIPVVGCRREATDGETDASVTRGPPGGASRRICPDHRRDLEPRGSNSMTYDERNDQSERHSERVRLDATPTTLGAAAHGNGSAVIPWQPRSLSVPPRGTAEQPSSVTAHRRDVGVREEDGCNDTPVHRSRRADSRSRSDVSVNCVGGLEDTVHAPQGGPVLVEQDRCPVAIEDVHFTAVRVTGGARAFCLSERPHGGGSSSCPGSSPRAVCAPPSKPIQRKLTPWDFESTRTSSP